MKLRFYTRVYILIFVITALAGMNASCARLDSFLFEGEWVAAYQLDAYKDKREISDLPTSYDIAANLITEVKMTSQKPDGTPVTIYGIYLGDIAEIALPTKKVILYLHGNTKHIDYYWNRAKLLANVGAKNKYGVFIIDYQGYGRSGGESSERGLILDTRTAIRWLKSKGLTSDRLIAFGYSMGTIAATYTTAYPVTLSASMLILEAPIASIEVMVQDGAGLALPGSYLTDLQGSEADWIKDVKVPFLWFHGKLDATVRWDTHGMVVYKNYGGAYSNKQKVLVENGEHANLPSVIGYAEYAATVESFILNH